MSKPEAKLKARELRQSGIAIKVIAKQLGVSPGSVHLWCQDIRLTEAQKKRIDKDCLPIQQRFLRAYVEQRRAKARLDFLEQHAKGACRVGTVGARDLLLLGLGLYWGEGSKRQKCTASIANMDPDVHKVFLSWLSLLGVPRSRVWARLFIGEDANLQNEMLWWSEAIDLDLNHFRRPTIKVSPTSQYKTKRDGYHGCLALGVHDTKLMSEICGMLHQARVAPRRIELRLPA